MKEWFKEMGFKPVFKNEEEYEKFRSDYRKRVVPILKEHARRRRLSEEAAKRHWVD
jgi:N-acetylglutamate synthase-like GNAT family acetyltransferase